MHLVIVAMGLRRECTYFVLALVDSIRHVACYNVKYQPVSWSRLIKLNSFNHTLLTLEGEERSARQLCSVLKKVRLVGFQEMSLRVNRFYVNIITD